jgi:sarcosine oxidase subunit beta
MYVEFEAATGCSVNFRAHGYLFVTADRTKIAVFEQNVALQRSLGVASWLVGPDEIARMVPGICADDLIAGTFCDADGSAEPAAAVQGFAAAARRLGATIVVGHDVTAIASASGRVIGVRAMGGGLGTGGALRTGRAPDAGTRIEAPVVVIAAGAYTADVARLAGVEIPARPFRRQVSVAEPISELDVEIPLTTDADSGFYVHRSGHADLMLGGTDRDVRPGYTLDVDGGVLDGMLAAAVRRIPALASVRIRRSYVGLRGLTPDFNMILGRVPGVEGLVVACGDNGHGFMHAPAIGLLLAEEILDGRATTLDLAPFRLERFAPASAAASATANPGERTMY